MTCRLQRCLARSSSITTHLCLLQTFLKAVQQFVKEVQAGGPLATDAKNVKGDAATAALSAVKPSAAKKAEVRGSFCRVSCTHQHCALDRDAHLCEACVACSAQRDEWVGEGGSSHFLMTQIQLLTSPVGPHVCISTVLLDRTLWLDLHACVYQASLACGVLV